MGTRLQNARSEAGWSQMQLARRIKEEGDKAGENVPQVESIKSSLSRWENGRRMPCDFYRRILRELFGKGDVELGFVSGDDLVHDLPAAEALSAQLALYETKFDSLVAGLRGTIEMIRSRDRDFGASSSFDSTRAHVDEIGEHLVHAIGQQQRIEMARLLADAASLAGWQALDLMQLEPSWRLYTTANDAARIAGDAALDAFTTIERSQILIPLGRAAQAAEIAAELLKAVQGRLAKAVECWVSAGAAELMAFAGEDERCHDLLVHADKLGPTLDGPRPPYLVFDRASLDRWIGHTLVILHADEAVERLELARSALTAPLSGRAGASLEIDLAAAYLNSKDGSSYDLHLANAERLAVSVGSQRCLTRIQVLKDKAA